MALPPTSSSTNSSLMVIHEGEHPDNTMEVIKAVIPYSILIITALGIVFNVFVLTVFCFHKKACTIPEIYLSNLAAADLILVSFLPFWAINVQRNFHWPFGNVMCKLVNLCISLNAYSSIYFLVLVSIDRFMALVHPLSHETIRRPKYAKLSCLLVWALGLILSVPVLIYRKADYSPKENATVCFLDYGSVTEIIVCDGMLVIFSFIVPITIISLCTFKIIQALKKREMEGLNSQRKEQKATTLVLAVLVAFLICWLPFHVTKIVELLMRAGVLSTRTLLDSYKLIVIYIAFFNSVLNPILYVIVGKNFRKKAKELFIQWNRRRIATFKHSSTNTYLSRSVNKSRSSTKS